MRISPVPGLIIALLGFAQLNGPSAFAERGDAMPDLKGKKVLIIIASKNFRDEEFSEPYGLLKKCGASVTIASSTKSPSKGILGKVVTPDLLLSECKVADYDGIIFIGGPGASEYFNDQTAQAIARAAVENKKVLGAICIAPVTLANAGVLKGRKATSFPSFEPNLTQQGAILVKQRVVQDGNIVTATGPEAARLFAETLVKMLNQDRSAED